MMTGRRKIPAGYGLCGLCYSDDCLYVVDYVTDPLRNAYSLAAFRVQSGSGNITLLDRLELEQLRLLFSVCPRIERYSQRVFVPCPESGVIVAHLNNGRLVRKRTLTCVRNPHSLDVMSPDTIYICGSRSVYVVDVRDDSIMSTLVRPDTLRDDARLRRLAVLGDSIMVGYDAENHTQVVYRHGSPFPVRVIPGPEGGGGLSAISIDYQSHFILAYYLDRVVIVIDINGKRRHTVNIGSLPLDCAMINRQLWAACSNGEIVIMSSQ